VIPYSQEAHRWFKSLERHRDAAMTDDPPSRSTWMRLTLTGGKGFTIPLVHGSEDATVASMHYVLSLPRMWERLGCKEMTILQALECKNRALIMGDVAASIRYLQQHGLLEEKFEGVVKVRNPYNFMSLELTRRLEGLDKTVPVVSDRAPKRWHSADCEDEYDVRAFNCPDRGAAVGIAIHNDIPDVSPFDLAGSIVLGKVG